MGFNPAWLASGVGGGWLWGKDGVDQQESVKLTPDKLPQQLAVSDQLSDYFQKYLPNYTPGQAYGGQYTAPMSQYETKGLSWLDQYLGKSPTGGLYDLASQELTKNLTGAYDPRTSPYYQGLRAESQANLEDQISQSRRGAGARGSYFTTGAMNDEERLRESNLRYLNTTLGGLYENEAARRFQAAPAAANLEQLGRTSALQQIGASQQYGALPRMIQQAGLESQYQDWLRQQSEKGGVVSGAQNYFATPISYGAKEIPLQDQNSFGSLLKSAAPLIGSILGNAIAPGVGGVIGGAAGSAASNIGSNFMPGVTSNSMAYNPYSSQYTANPFEQTYYSQYLR